MIIELLNFFHFEDLYNFELDNRYYFEQFIPPLDDSFYLHDNFLKNLKDTIKLQESSLAIYYLIKDNDGKIIGTISLVNIDHEKYSANLECKISENFTGRGIATYALKTLIDIIDKDLIKEIYCNITHLNIGFQKVLEKNGFQLIYINSDEFDIKGNSTKNLIYILKLS